MHSRIAIGMGLGITSVLAGMGLARLERAMHARADEAEIDQLIDRLYASISGPESQDRDWQAFHACFADGARLGAFFATPDGFGSVVMTPTQYQERAGPELMRLGFTEHEAHRKLELFGTVAHAFSTYKGTTAAEPVTHVEGINSIQLVRTGEGWRVFSLVWQQASEKLPVPEAYRGAAE
jgi:hypothetical protein